MWCSIKLSLGTPVGVDVSFTTTSFLVKVCALLVSTWWLFSFIAACSCNSTGTENGTTCQHLGGQCRCKPGVTGRSCDHCLPGYFNFSDSGCTGMFSSQSIVHVGVAEHCWLVCLGSQIQRTMVCVVRNLCVLCCMSRAQHKGTLQVAGTFQWDFMCGPRKYPPPPHPQLRGFPSWNSNLALYFPLEIWATALFYQRLGPFMELSFSNNHTLLGMSELTKCLRHRWMNCL